MNAQSHVFLSFFHSLKISVEAIKYIVLSILILLSHGIIASAQNKQDLEIRAATNFLNTSDELQNYSKNGFTSTFTGKFLPISQSIQTELGKNLPEYKFRVAEMNVDIDPPRKKYKLILIMEADTLDIKGFIWANYWTLPTSKSFQDILKGIKTNSDQEAVGRVKSFANLLAFTSNDKVGKAKIQNKKIKVEMLRGEGVFAILEARIDNFWRFDSLNITEPNGNRLKIFV